MVYYVLNGEMHSAVILGYLDIDIKVGDDNKISTPIDIAHKILIDTNSDYVDSRLNGSVNQLDVVTKRSGRWYYLSGSEIVHSDDCYDSREEAAEAYKNYLISEG